MYQDYAVKYWLFNIVPIEGQNNTSCLTASPSPIYGFQKGPVFSDERIDIWKKKILQTYSYGPKMKIKRGKGPMETTVVVLVVVC